ncbi:hypothetical protein GCM10022243_42160 [Saccharothrix violaceirubra]
MVAGGQGPGNGSAGYAVVPVGCGQGRKALGDADSDALDGASAVPFQVGPAREEAIDRLDEPAVGLAQRLAGRGVRLR